MEAEEVDPAPLEEHPTSEPDPEIQSPPPMPESAEEDELQGIGKDALLPLLKSTRSVIDSEEFQRRLVDHVDRIVDIPWVPDSLEAATMDRVYDLIQDPAVAALDSWIEELEG